MAEQETQPAVLTNGQLQQFIGVFHKELPVVVQVGKDQFLGVLSASTAVLKPGNVLVLNMTAIKTVQGKDIAPVVVPAE